MPRVILLLTLAFACSDPPSTPRGDAGFDGGRVDAGRVDGGSTPDGGSVDGAVDARTLDSGSADAGSADAGSADAGQATCMGDPDCVWGEIDHEITRTEDCICLFGCPSFIQNRTTRDRRAMQYEMYCDPRFDGMGHPCPIDDCIEPPPLFCRDGVCGM